MKTPIRILLVVLCAALVIAMPFAIYSPVQNSAGEEGGDEEEIDFSRLFISAAYAEEEEVLLDRAAHAEPRGIYGRRIRRPVHPGPGRNAEDR